MKIRALIVYSLTLLLGGCVASHPGLEIGWALQEERAALPDGPQRNRNLVHLAPGDRFYVSFATTDREAAPLKRLQTYTFEAGPLGLTSQQGEVQDADPAKPPKLKTFYFPLGTPVGSVISDLYKSGLLVAKKLFHNQPDTKIADVQVRLAPRKVTVFRDGQSQELNWSPAMTLADVLRSTGGPRSIGETDPYYLAVVEPRKYDGQGRLVSEPAGSFFVSAYSGTYAGDAKKVVENVWENRRRNVYVYPNDRIRIERSSQANFGIHTPKVN